MRAACLVAALAMAACDDSPPAEVERDDASIAAGCDAADCAPTDGGLPDAAPLTDAMPPLTDAMPPPPDAMLPPDDAMPPPDDAMPPPVEACADEACGVGTCEEQADGGYTCHCPAGYDGTTSCTDIDECAGDPCGPGTCTNTDGGYACSCPAGYTGTTSCSDLDECAQAPCGAGSCANTAGSYECTCPTGYTGSGTQACNDVNECVDRPCGPGTCTNRLGSYECACPAGYTGTGSCTDIDECAAAPCGPGSCTNRPGGYACTCPRGYTGSGSCTDIDECATQPCPTGAACTNQPGSYACACPAEAPTVCAGACVDVDSDVAHCGGCGLRCGASNAICEEGSCGCPAQAYCEYDQRPSQQTQLGGFGYTGLGLDGDLMVVGASRVRSPSGATGVAYVYEWDGYRWGGEQLLESGSEFWEEEDFGRTADVSGTRIVVGAPLHHAYGNRAGAAYVFERTASGWARTELALRDPRVDELFGSSVAIDGERIVVSAPGTGSGRVFVFERDVDGWTYDELPTGDASAFGRGRAVALDGERIAVLGSHTYVYEHDASGWTETTLPEAADGAAAVAISGARIALGKVADEEGQPGHAYLFEKGDGWALARTWTPIPDEQHGHRDNRYFGEHVALDGDLVVVSSRHVKGTLYLYQYAGGRWTQQQHMSRLGPFSGSFVGSVAAQGRRALAGGFFASSSLGGAVFSVDVPLPGSSWFSIGGVRHPATQINCGPASDGMYSMTTFSDLDQTMFSVVFSDEPSEGTYRLVDDNPAQAGTAAVSILEAHRRLSGDVDEQVRGARRFGEVGVGPSSFMAHDASGEESVTVAVDLVCK